MESPSPESPRAVSKVEHGLSIRYNLTHAVKYSHVTEEYHLVASEYAGSGNSLRCKDMIDVGKE